MKSAIVLLVFAMHLWVVFGSLFALPGARKKEKKPLVVKTLSLSPAPKQFAALPASKPAPAPLSAPVKKELPPVMEKQVQKAKKVPPAVAKKEPKRGKNSQKLLQELEESIAKIEGKDFAKKQRASPSTPLSLQIDAKRGKGEEATGMYADSLVGQLKQALHLPDFGEVKIQLTLRKDGSLAKIVVLKTESEKNRRYLETHLPHLKFPPLEGKEKEKTYTLTFCNEL